MTEAEARARVATIVGSSMPRVERYVAELLEENHRQNLIARSTEPTIWARHVLDCAQLAAHARPSDRILLDVGSGAGLPGIVLGILGRWYVMLVEPRRKRADFLKRMATILDLANVQVVHAAVETVRQPADLITARAVASIGEIFGITRECTGSHTRYLLPKGRSAEAEVDSAKAGWHGVFHVEQSLTDPSAGIVIADRVSRR